MTQRPHEPIRGLNDPAFEYLGVGGRGLPPVPGIGASNRRPEELGASRAAAELGIDGLRRIVEATEDDKKVFGPASDVFRRMAQTPTVRVNRAIYGNGENIADL